MEEEKIFNLMEKMYREIVDIKEGQQETNNRLDKLEIKIENEITDKLNFLYDGFHQMTKQLNRIEEKVDQHDEIIIKRVK